MSDFLEHIITRHTNPAQPIQPRLNSRFETTLQANDSFDRTEDAATSTLFSGNVLNDQPVNLKSGEKESLEKVNLSNEGISQFSEDSNLTTKGLNFVSEKQYSDIQSEPHSTEPGEITGIEGVEHQQRQDLGMDDLVKFTGKKIRPEKYQIPTTLFNHSVTERKQDQRMADYLVIPPALNGNISLPLLNQQNGQSLIKVTIGRIDVRANNAAASSKTISNVANSSRMSLDDYFKKKSST